MAHVLDVLRTQGRAGLYLSQTNSSSFSLPSANICFAQAIFYEAERKDRLICSSLLISPSLWIQWAAQNRSTVTLRDLCTLRYTCILSRLRALGEAAGTKRACSTAVSLQYGSAQDAAPVKTSLLHQDLESIRWKQDGILTIHNQSNHIHGIVLRS